MELLRLALAAALALSSAACTRGDAPAEQDAGKVAQACKMVVVRIEVHDVPFEGDFELFLPLRGPASALLPVNGAQVLPLVGSVTGFQRFAARDGVFEALVPLPAQRDLSDSIEGELRDEEVVVSFGALRSCVR